MKMSRAPEIDITRALANDGEIVKEDDVKLLGQSIFRGLTEHGYVTLRNTGLRNTEAVRTCLLDRPSCKPNHLQ